MWIWCLTKYSISITVKQISFKLKKYIYLQNIRVSTEEWLNELGICIT